MTFKNLNKLFTLIIYYKLLKVPSYKTQSYYSFPLRKENICIEDDSNGSESKYGPVLHSYIWVAYSKISILPLSADIISLRVSDMSGDNELN
jgi:hypothetical protein